MEKKNNNDNDNNNNKYEKKADRGVVFDVYIVVARGVRYLYIII